MEPAPEFWFDYDRTARDVTDIRGETLECGEEPIKITVFSSGFGKKYPWGHVQLEYGGQVIDFEAKGMRNLRSDQPHIFDKGIRHYFIFPSETGIDGNRLRYAIARQRLRAGEYNLLLNNCANQVREVLEEAGARGIEEFRPLDISIPERIGRWCEKNGVRIDVPTTNLYRFERRKDFSCLKNMLYFSHKILSGRDVDIGAFSEEEAGKQMREFMVRKAAMEIKHILRKNRHDFGAGKVFVDHLNKVCPHKTFLEKYGIEREMEHTRYALEPGLSRIYLARRRSLFFISGKDGRE